MSVAISRVEEQIAELLKLDHDAWRWIRPADQVPSDGQLVLALHTSWGAPRPAIANYNAGGEWYAGGMSLMCVVGWMPIPPLDAP